MTLIIVRDGGRFGLTGTDSVGLSFVSSGTMGVHNNLVGSCRYMCIPNTWNCLLNMHAGSCFVL